MQASTLFKIVTHYQSLADATGLSVNDLELSVRKIATATKLKWDTVKTALEEDRAGFNQEDKGWRLTKDFTKKDYRDIFNSDLSDRIKVAWWKDLKEKERCKELTVDKLLSNSETFIEAITNTDKPKSEDVLIDIKTILQANEYGDALEPFQFENLFKYLINELKEDAK